MPKFYPTTPRNKKQVNTGEILALTKAKINQQQGRFIDYLAPINDNAPVKKFCDDFINEIASIGTRNSLMQYSHFVDNRLSYSECAILKNQHYIANTIQAYSNDLIDKKGTFSLLNANTDDLDSEQIADIISQLETALNKLDFWKHFKDLIEKSLIFGGAFLFLNFDNEMQDGAIRGSLDDDINLSFEKLSVTKLRNLKVIEPYLCSPFEVNTIDPTQNDYMQPKKWYLTGKGSISSTRLISFVLNEAPDLIKPIYNFLGISKVQEMKEAVKIAESLNNANAEIALRFRTKIIKTPLLKTNEAEAVERAELFNLTQNNLGLLYLLNTEEYIENNTSLTGLSDIQNLALQNVASAAYIPRNKLLGDEPNGFSSGEFTIKNYYDTIESLQNTILKPFLLKIAQIVLYGLGFDYQLDFAFNPVAQETDKEKAEKELLKIDKVMKLLENNLIDTEQAFNIAQRDGLIPSDEKFQNETANINQNAKQALSEALQQKEPSIDETNQ